MNRAQNADSTSSSGANMPRTLMNNTTGLTSSLYPSADCPVVGRAFSQEVVTRRDSYAAVLISTII